MVPGLLLGERTPEEKTCYCNLVAVGMHPTSRGSVHAASSNPSANPDVDIAYLRAPFDLEIAKLAVKYLIRLSETDAMKAVISECLTKSEIETNRKSEDPIKDYCRRNVATCFHWIGTAAMLPRENGGVVDPRLRVYGTTNLRVVRGRDRSVWA